ncbi:2'-5' RNA ligase family protein [Nocardia arthritidis]|uniref:2'-5' RNA ligase family protein n=1 Tax=Nocardia arthritidis TaxID=228602 RepID=A0A6G9Y660_9NOCA|nr:2'-5' RNA ligase family protein [Nocardia arthritidis]QIS08590.1 hypothetical protein F5544_03375 [Nocardia arthritidis]
MRNIFDPSVLKWPWLRDSLHVYVLPDPQFATSVQPTIDAIGVFPDCAPVTSRWLHATVTRIPWWRNEVTPSSLDRYSDALAAIASATPPFEIPMSGPVIHTSSVLMAATPDHPNPLPDSSTLFPAWQALVDHTREAATHIFGPTRQLPPPPAFPHVSLAYAVTDCDSTPLERALEYRSVSTTLTVHTLHFLAVHQDPQAGTFTWDPISSHHLTNPAT